MTVDAPEAVAARAVGAEAHEMEVFAAAVVAVDAIAAGRGVLEPAQEENQLPQRERMFTENGLFRREKEKNSTARFNISLNAAFLDGSYVR